METCCRSRWNCKPISRLSTNNSHTETQRTTITMVISSPREQQSLAIYGMPFLKYQLISGQSTIPPYTIPIHIHLIPVASSVPQNMPTQNPSQQIKHPPPSGGDEEFVPVNISPQIQCSSPSQRYVGHLKCGNTLMRTVKWRFLILMRTRTLDLMSDHFRSESIFFSMDAR
jgi:hypothetical protein